jgi:antibiotic biosynthesis monooxygenase (ABM) superfamily enzyme
VLRSSISNVRVSGLIGASVLIFAALLFSSQLALAQFSEQGPKLVGSGAIGQSVLGSSVALSADGNTAIVGGFEDNSGTGAAWVYTRANGAWTQQGSKLVGSGAVGAAVQGVSVALSADGNTAIVGGPHDNGEAGAAWIYTRSGGVWTQQGGKLVGSDAVGVPVVLQGYSVALSGDGNTAIVGGQYDNEQTGAAWVYARANGVWTQQGGKLLANDAVGHAEQGYSVALSGDGNTAIVGGPYDNGETGAAWIYTRSGGVWTQQGGKLVGAGGVGPPYQGWSVTLSADGNTAIVGGPYDNSSIGAAWAYARGKGAWTQQGSKLVGSGAVGTAYQGRSVALSADGNTAILGGPDDNGQTGAAWAYSRNGSLWTQRGLKLVGGGTVGLASQGLSVALSAGGNKDHRGRAGRQRRSRGGVGLCPAVASHPYHRRYRFGGAGRPILAVIVQLHAQRHERQRPIFDRHAELAHRLAEVRNSDYIGKDHHLQDQFQCRQTRSQCLPQQHQLQRHDHQPTERHSRCDADRHPQAIQDHD